MRRDEEEILIRDDSGLLYDDSVTVSSVRPRPAGWWHNMNKTLCLSLAFFVMGMCISVPGPTLIDLAEKINTDIPHISTIFSARAVGYLVGAILGGALFNYFDKQLLMFCTLLMVSVATIVIPWCFTLVAMGTLVALQGLGLGILYTGGNIFCVKLWGRKNAPYLQTLHFAFALGAFLAPLLAKPFLSNENLFANTTALKSEPNESLIKTRNVRSDFYNEKLYYLFNNFEGIDGFLSKNEKEHRNKRDNGAFDTDLDTTSHSTMKKDTTSHSAVKKDTTSHSTVKKDTTTSQSTVKKDTTTGHSTVKKSTLKSSGTTKHATSPHTVVPTIININNNVSAQNQNTIVSGALSNATQNGTKVTGSVIVTTKTPTISQPTKTTPKVTKPKAAVDTHLKEHTADGKHLSDLKQASEPVKPPEDKHTETKNDKTTTKTSQKVTEPPNINGSQTVPPVNNSVTGNQSSQTGKQTVVPSTTVGLVAGNRDLKNESGPGMNQSSPPTETTGKPSTVKTTKKESTTSSSTTTTTTTTTTTPKPTTTTTTTTTTVPKPKTTATSTTTTTEKASAKPTKQTQKPPERTTKKTLIPSSSQKIATENPQSTKISSAVTKGSENVSKTTAQSPTAEITTKVPKKPTTAEDIFNNVIGLVKTISKIQFVYAIIGTVVFVSSVIFLIFYCRNKKRLTFAKGDDYYEGVKGNTGCFKVSVLFMLFLFFICYVGLEVAFGGFVTYFSVGFNHWPKEQGAIVTAIFWGAVAVGRGFSIFISRCCRPTVMLSADLCLMVFAGLVLSIGTYFLTKLLWLGTLILGLGMSSVLPGIISWTETYFPTTGKSTAVFVMGSTLGEMFLPIMTSYLFTIQDEMVLMRLTLALGAILLVLFIVMSCYAAHNGETYTLRDRNGFLPLQAEDNNDENVEMDLMDIDTPQKRRKHRRKEQEELEVLIPLSDLEED